MSRGFQKESGGEAERGAKGLQEQYRKYHAEKGEAMAKTLSTLELASQLRHASKSIERLGVKAYNWWNESLHGVARAGIATVFPQAIAMAATFDADTVEQVASVISTEARAKYNESQKKGDCGIYKGLTMWSPNINIFRDPRWGRGHETYGEDPYLTGLLGAAYVRGLQGTDEKYIKTAACVKHFAVHSGPESERHTFNAQVSKKDLFETYLPAFQTAVEDAKVCGVMGAYNRLNGEPCCASPTLMQTILRDDWGFQGYYVSDCSALLDVVFKHRATLSPTKGAAMALNAGCDLECGVLYSLLPVSVAMGYTQKETLQKSAARLFSIRSALGMFDEACPYHAISPAENATAAHEDFAVNVAEQGLVLLENDGVLPLKPNAQKILITGYNAENDLAYLGNYFGEPQKFCKVPEAFREENKETDYTLGFSLYKEISKDQKAELLEKAKAADVIFVCTGLDSSCEGEEAGGILAGGGGAIGKQGDRETLDLPQNQKEIIEMLLGLGKKIVLLNFSGGCIDFRPYKNRVNAILQCWYPGARGGKAIANVVFGKTSPSGKLPVTFYNSIQDLPDFTDYRMENRTYRYFKGAVQYPFGYGLSYCNFDLKEFSYNEAEKAVKIHVHNPSERDGYEVLELFLSYPENAKNQPVKKLIRAKRLFLKQGETAEVSLPLTEKDFYAINENGDTVYLKGKYTLSLCDGQSIEAAGIFVENSAETKCIKPCVLP